MNDKQVDLHNHTHFSDGALSPAQIVKVAKDKEIAALGITDHDTLEGVAPAKAAGKKYGLEIVPGIELSTNSWGKELHLLGYYCDPHNQQLKVFLDKMSLDRQDRMKKMIAGLKEMGLEVDLTEVFSKTKGKAPGRPHLASVLHQKGFCRSPGEAFQKYIGKGCPAYVEREKLDFFKAINLVRAAGGISVLAHPGIYSADYLIPSLIKGGLLGIEVFHPDHGVKDEKNYLRIAQKYNLLITGGSDYHGGGVGSASAVGTVTISYQYLEKLKGMV